MIDKNYDPSMDFNLETDAKAPALIPDGIYHGTVNSVVFDKEKRTIVWKVTLSDNGGFMSDDETAIDGATLTYTNWLPKPGDEKELTNSGRMTKWQAKINMLAEFVKKMNVQEKTLPALCEAIDDALYIGKEVSVVIGTKVYQDITSNEIKKMYSPEGDTPGGMF